MSFVVFVPLLIVRMASASPVCESSLPLNIDAGPLHVEAIHLLHASPTFRRQCARVAVSPVLRVTVRLTGVLVETARAQTVISRYDAGAIRAEVTLRFGEDYQELLAHEFEHVLEQVDGVVLRDEVATGRAWRTDSGAFETRRAYDAGVRAREEAVSSADAPEPRIRQPPRSPRP